MDEPITSFDGEYRFLSNFYESIITYNEKTYTTVEHAYQASKAVNESDADRIRIASTPGLAKRIGREIEIRANWIDVRYPIM